VGEQDSGSREPRGAGTGSDLVAELTGTWDYSTLPSNVYLGRDCFIENQLAFSNFSTANDPGLVLGDRVRVYGGGWGSSFGIKHPGVVTIGDDSILVGAQFMCAERISVGRRVIISYNAILSDGDFHPIDPVLRNEDARYSAPFSTTGRPRPPWTPQPVTIGDDVRIGINAIVLKGVTVGDRASILAGAVVTSDVPADSIVAGNPARLVDPEP
jgi:acetyltransferase-like isoleucine patch superfamily enzyme